MELFYKGCKVSFESVGKGSAVVLLHGFLENKKMWDEISKTLSKNHKIITLDLLGHGNTDNKSYIHSMEEQAQMVKFVLDFLKLRRYFLIGHSMGGYVALAFAQLYPKNVKGISLMNSTAFPDSEEKKQNRDRGIEAVKKNRTLFVKTAIPLLFSKKNKTLFKSEIQEVIQQALQTNTQGIIAALEGMKIRNDFSNLYKSALFPIQLIIGKQDPALNYLSLLKQVENTNTEVIEFLGGHMSHIENKTALIKVFKSFLKLKTT